MTERIEANVAILGAGPAGTAAAAHLGQLGVRGVVLVDRHDFPRDKTCGSGVSPKGIKVLQELGVWQDVEPQAYRILGIRLVTSSGFEAWRSAGEAFSAVVCQRRVLDQLLLDKARSQGVTFHPNFDATELLEEGGRTVGFKAKDGREVRARTVLVAGGTHCRLDRVERPRRVIQAIMGWWEGVSFRPNHLEMIFDHMLGPYYGWMFPESDARVNIGITYEDGTQHGDTNKSANNRPVGKENARDLFKRFLAKHYGERLANAKQLGGWKGHPIAWSYDIERLTAPGRLTIGESGLLTHPATAEGIYQGMRSGMLAAEAVRDVDRGVLREELAWARYERECRRAFLLSFRVGGAALRGLAKGDALDRLVRVTSHPLVESATAKLMANL